MNETTIPPAKRRRGRPAGSIDISKIQRDREILESYRRTRSCRVTAKEFRLSRSRVDEIVREALGRANRWMPLRRNELISIDDIEAWTKSHCDYCSEPINPARYGARYCSDICRNTVQKQARKAQHIAPT